MDFPIFFSRVNSFFSFVLNLVFKNKSKSKTPIKIERNIKESEKRKIKPKKEKNGTEVPIKNRTKIQGENFGE